MKTPAGGNIIQRILQFNIHKNLSRNSEGQNFYPKQTRTAWDSGPKKKKPSWFTKTAQGTDSRTLYEDFQKFCHETTLHGLFYIGQPRLHILERIFWSIAFLLGILSAGALIYSIFRQFKANPIIVTFGASHASIDKVPFPAVTICNVNNVKKSRIDALQEGITKPPHGLEQYVNFYRNCLYHLDHACMATGSFSNKLNFSSEGSSMESLPIELMESVKESAARQPHTQAWVEFILLWAVQECKDMIILCRWEDESKNCNELFRPIVTDYGLCCAFNVAPPNLWQKFEFRSNLSHANAKIMQSTKWNLSDQSDLSIEGLLLDSLESKPVPEFPYRSKRSGLSYGLSFLVDPDISEYFCTSSDSTGFHLVNHLSIESAHVTEYGLGIGPDLEAFIKITPDITIADDAIKFLKPKSRKCYLPGEHTLKYYLNYSYGNCFDECLANSTYNDCGCVRYFMTRDDNRTLCGPGVQNDCADTTKKEFVVVGKKGRCPECLPTCTDISYLTEMTTRPMRNDKEIWRKSGMNMPEKWAKRNVSLVHVYFGEDDVYPKIRKRLYSVTDLIAGTGGILGLCLGLSILTGIEIIYFLVAKVFWKHLIVKWMNRKTSAVSEFERGKDSKTLALIGQSAVDEIMFTRKNLELNKAHHSTFY